MLSNIKKTRDIIVAIPGQFASICEVTSESVGLTLRLVIADPSIHINGSNSVRLSTGSALYCGLIAGPYIHINGGNSVRLSAGSALHSRLIADPYIHISGCRQGIIGFPARRTRTLL